MRQSQAKQRFVSGVVRIVDQFLRMLRSRQCLITTAAPPSEEVYQMGLWPKRADSAAIRVLVLLGLDRTRIRVNILETCAT